MIDIATLLTYALVVLGLFLIPGPAVLLVLARGTSGGRRVGIATGLGIACGDLLHTLAASLGLSAVLMTSALAFDAVKFAGAGYLIWLGIKAIRAPAADLAVASLRPIGAGRAWRQAILAEVLNPKTALFFLAFLPQFVQPGRGAVVAQFAELGLVFAVMSAAYTMVVAVAAGQLGRFLARHKRIGRWQNRITGGIFLALGVRLALQRR
jgi:threonine/homoserine/homoserine lactone efflux protein